MAEARDRRGLSPRARASRGGVRVARAGALVGVALFLLLGYRALELTGFRPRWERSALPAPAAGAPVGGAASARRPTLPPPPVSPGSAARRGRVDDGATAAGGVSGESGERTAGGVSRTPGPVGTPGSGVPHGTTRPGTGQGAAIDFETFADGTAACAPCDVADEWSTLGLVVSFHSWTAGSPRPTVLDAREYLPPGRGTRALGPALTPERGLEVGVIQLDFTRRPRRVSFSLFGPDLIRSFDVSVWSLDRAVDRVRVARAPLGTYEVSTGRGSFREERIVVDVKTGIDRISVDGWGPPGHLLLIDDLVIEP